MNDCVMNMMDDSACVNDLTLVHDQYTIEGLLCDTHDDESVYARAHLNIRSRDYCVMHTMMKVYTHERT